MLKDDLSFILKFILIKDPSATQGRGIFTEACDMNIKVGIVDYYGIKDRKRLTPDTERLTF